MIYMEPASLGWRPVLDSWLNILPDTITDNHKNCLRQLFDRFADAGIAHVRKRAKVSKLFIFNKKKKHMSEKWQRSAN